MKGDYLTHLTKLLAITALRMFGTTLHDTARHDTGNNRGCHPGVGL